MKKISLPMLLLGIIVIPILILYLVDKNGAITNPIESESEFIHLITPEVLKSLSDGDKQTLTERFSINAINLLDGKKIPSRKYENGAFFCIFFNDVNRSGKYLKFSFRKKSEDSYYSLYLQPGLFEKLTMSEHTQEDNYNLFTHYIPLLHNRYNSFQVDFIESHILVILNRKIIFHFLLEESDWNGMIEFESNIEENVSLRQARFASIPEPAIAKIQLALKHVPSISIKK